MSRLSWHDAEIVMENVDQQNRAVSKKDRVFLASLKEKRPQTLTLKQTRWLWDIYERATDIIGRN